MAERVDSRMAVQVTAFFALGAAVGYFTSFAVPSAQISELFKALGVLIAISGSLLGWSAGWLDQSRKLLKDVEYEKAEFLQSDLAVAQKKLIWRWGTALASAIVVVAMSVFVAKSFEFRWLETIIWCVAAGSLSVSAYSLTSLFRSLLAAVELKSKLEAFELKELRRLRQLPPKDVTSNTSQAKQLNNP